MIKKLQQRLLERYPHIWNMRLLPVAAVTLLVHFLHWIVGYCFFSDVEHIPGSVETAFFSSPFFLISGIISFLVILLWLIRVFRNNAFKSFYPVSNLYLFREFCIFLLVFFCNTTYYVSFNAGFLTHGRMATDYAVAVAESHIYQETEVLFSAEKGDYDISGRQSPSPFPMSRRYRYEDIAEANDTAEAVEGTAAVVGAEQARMESDTSYYYLGSDSNAYSQAYVDSVSGGYQFSYLNFSGHTYFYNDYPLSYDRYGPSDNRYNFKMINWLRTGQKDSVRYAMAALLKICDKYKVPYHIDLDEWYRWVYNPPYFPVTYTIANPWYNKYDDRIYSNTDAVTLADADDEGSKYNPRRYFIKKNKLENIIESTLSLHNEPILSGNILLILFCVALSFAILIYTFRITSGRIWLISLIGSALLGLVTGVISFFIAYGMHRGDDEGMVIMGFYLALILAFYLVAQLSVNGSGSRTIAGVALTWLLWSLPFVPFLLLGMYTTYEESKDLLRDHVNPPLLEWLEMHRALYGYLSLLFYILLVLALTPLCRRWQAMGEN